MNDAFYFDRVRDHIVTCALCPHHCLIHEGKTGLCGMRLNTGGKLYAYGYGLVSSIALDPIEKKPLRQFYPGTKVLSIGGFGCNLICPFCQNYQISREYQARLESSEVVSPSQITSLAIESQPRGNIGVAYTYNEPLVGYEFVHDCARLVRAEGLKNILVTNGYIEEKPLRAILPYIDAMNIDLKGFTDAFYHKLGGNLQPVKDTIQIANKHCHIEVTTLVIPGENDSAEEIEALVGWLAAIDVNIPLHLTRFFPRYQYSNQKATPIDVLNRLGNIAMSHLKNVFFS